MMKPLLAFMLLCSVASGQSIVFTNTDTFAFNGRISAVESSVSHLRSDLSEVRSDIKEIKTCLQALSQSKPDTPVQPVLPQPTRLIRQNIRQWYLVSEPWCAYCRPAKASFLARGWPESHIISRAECQRRFGFTPERIPHEFEEPLTTVTQQPVNAGQSRYYNYRGTVYDLATFNGCSSGRCAMCAEIRGAQQRYRQSLYSVPAEVLTPAQEPSPDDLIDKAIDLLPLTPDSVLADPGCGDGRVLIRAVQRTGCTGIGVEIDPVMADKARRSVKAAGLSHRIQIIQGDAVDFRPGDYGVTSLYCYLYPDLLEKLKDKFVEVGSGVSVFHEVPGLPMKDAGEVWVYPQS